ncbi:MAG TPA: hypothetical protein VFJ05_00180, partial [Nitrososphaeraceae archaeon]|nr:hypothetical protein [Nitrososphaeraceae archaeon]
LRSSDSNKKRTWIDRVEGGRLATTNPLFTYLDWIGIFRALHLESVSNKHNLAVVDSTNHRTICPL